MRKTTSFLFIRHSNLILHFGVLSFLIILMKLRFVLRLLVECFTKYGLVNEAMRHFRALKRIPGGTKVLYHEGKYGDPLSLYLRSLCLEGIL